jgi:acyl-coenzyme A synthetase/AMP-(fatty) acid ligase
VSLTELFFFSLQGNLAVANADDSSRNGGEYPRAFVVRKEGATVTEGDLFNMIKEHFAPHKWLTGGVYFTDKIPRTGSGKIMRRHLPEVQTDDRAKL